MTKGQSTNQSQLRRAAHAADLALLSALRSSGHWPPLERAVARFSRTGERSALWFTAAGLGLLVDRRRRGTYLRLGFALAATEVINASLKIAVGRPRPPVGELPALAAVRSQRSFPSAHAATSFAAARILSQVLSPAPLYLTASTMALSRPYLGVHYPSDAVGGLFLGLAIGSLARPGGRSSKTTGGHDG